MFFTTAVQTVVLDMRQLALARTISPADEGTELSLKSSVARATSSGEALYTIFRNHRQTGEPFFDNAVLALEQASTEEKVLAVKQDIPKQMDDLNARAT